jgi:hypothetical protein
MLSSSRLKCEPDGAFSQYTDFLYKNTGRLKEYKPTDKQHNISEKRFKVNADLKKSRCLSQRRQERKEKLFYKNLCVLCAFARNLKKPS